MTPFPLEGGRAGDGGGGQAAPTPSTRAEHPEQSEPARPSGQSSTPIPGPSPLQGEGRTARARRLRQDATLPERLVWAELRKLKANWRRQVPFGPYTVDFASHAAALIVELDGPVHALFGDADREKERTTFLTELGCGVLRFTNRDVLDELAAVIDSILAHAAPPPSAALPPSRGKGAYTPPTAPRAPRGPTRYEPR